MPRRKPDPVPEPTSPGTAYGYGRVSTDEQAKSGLSLQIQRENIERWMQCYGTDYRNGGVVMDEGISGSIYFVDRPRGKELASKLKEGDAIIFYKLDRGFRSLRDGVHMMDVWEKKGVRVVIMELQIDTSTTTGKFLVGFLMLVAEFERSRIRERQAEAFAKIKAMGRKHNKGRWTNRKRSAEELKWHAWIYEQRMDGKGWTWIQVQMFRMHVRSATKSTGFWGRPRIEKGFKEECERLEKLRASQTTSPPA